MQLKPHQSESESAERVLAFVALGIFLGAVTVQIYAGLELRGLYADGAHYFVKIVSLQDLFIVEPSRRTTQTLLQIPSIIAIKLGLESLRSVLIIFSLTLELLPWLITLACYVVLPRDKKILFLLPAFHYFAGTLSMTFAGIAEGATTAAYFWLLFYLILFGPNTWPWRVALGLLAIPALLLHQVMAVLCLPLIAAAFLKMDLDGNRRDRLILPVLIVWFVLIATVQIRYVIYPRDPANATGYFSNLISLNWLFVKFVGWNVPALVGLIALLAAAAICCFRRIAFIIVLTFGLAVAIITCAALTLDQSVPPKLQFDARNHPALISAPLALVALFVYWRPYTLVRCKLPQIVAVFAMLASSTLTWHVVGIRDWATFVQGFEDALQSRQGRISWEQLLLELPPGQADLFGKMYWSWTNPDMSLALARQSTVQSIVSNPKDVQWQPYDPGNALQLPTSKFFDVGPYIRALRGSTSSARSPGAFQSGIN